LLARRPSPPPASADYQRVIILDNNDGASPSTHAPTTPNDFDDDNNKTQFYSQLGMGRVLVYYVFILSLKYVIGKNYTNFAYICMRFV
jgi:hypothetical protein